MAGFSTYLDNMILNWIRGTAFAAAPSSVYVALFNGDPTDAGSGGTEVTTQIRAAGRVAATFGAPSAGAISNSGAVDFGQAANNATLTHFAIFDAASSGNMLASGALQGQPISAIAGTAYSFAAGFLIINLN